MRDSLARLDATVHWGTFQLWPDLPVTTEPDLDGWLLCSNVLGGDVLARWRDRIALALARQHGVSSSQVPPVVPDSYQLAWYADVIAWTSGALFHRDRRVPGCSAEQVAFRLDADGYPAHVALLDPHFACLPGDPDAGHPHAHVLPDEQSLAACLHEQVIDHARLFLEVWQPDVRVGGRSRWGAVSDALDCAPWGAGMEGGDDEAGVASSRLLLAGARPPLRPGSRIYQGVDLRGRPFWSRHRHTCCFAYRLPTGEACFSCPRTSDVERARRAAEWPTRGVSD